MSRALASVVRVGQVAPIEGADFIEIASIEHKAWKCVIKKGELAPGDLAVYMEIDSFLPEEPRYEFLRKSSFREMGDQRGFRLRTARFRGQISQGLMLPIAAFPELSDATPGDDVTAALHIELYQPPLSPALVGQAKGAFPAWLHKSEQERIQNLVHYFDEYRDVEFEVTVKMDGTSCSVYHRDGEHGVCSRNLELLETDDNIAWQVVRRLGLRERLTAYGRNVMLQGELCGEGIQKNRDRIPGQNLFVYDIFDIDAYRYVSADERRNILDALNALGGETIEHVPVVERTKVFAQCPSFDELMAYADGPSYLDTNRREGIVCKSEPIDGHVVSFKVINNKYLVEHGE